MPNSQQGESQRQSLDELQIKLCQEVRGDTCSVYSPRELLVYTVFALSFQEVQDTCKKLGKMSSMGTLYVSYIQVKTIHNLGQSTKKEFKWIMFSHRQYFLLSAYFISQ